MKIINDRYRIIETLVKENNMVEYLVEDLKKNATVKRLRIFDTEMSNQEFIINFEQRFIEVASLFHENLLSSYEFQTVDLINGSRVNRNQFFYTYEHYDDSSLLRYVDLNKSEIAQVLVQLCKVVRYLHFRGYVYKYLNFDAMIIMRVKGKITLKLREFANNYVDDYFFKIGHERNNHFVAPEVLWGEVPDVTADIYALGNIFYYLYYKVDYTQKSIQNIQKSQQLTDVHKFIIRATSHIKDERHHSIDDFIDGLSHLILVPIDNDDSIYYDRLYDLTRIIGRDSVLRDIRKMIDDKQRKNSQVNAVFLRGPVGSGKSRVLQEIQFTCKIQRINHIFIPKQDGNDRMGILRTIVAHVTSMDDISPILIQKYGIELAEVVPELKTKWNIKEEMGEVSQLRILNRVYNFFLEYTANHFFVLLIDDETAIESDIRYFFDLLIHQKNQANYCCIIANTISDTDLPYSEELAKSIKLTSLNLEETGYLVMSSLGMHNIPYKLTHRLMIETQGVPSVTKRMIRRLWQDGVIYFDAENLRWELDRVDDSFKFQYESKYSSELEKILDNLTERQIGILKELAILKDSFNMSVILEFTGITEEEAYYFIYYMEEAKIITKKISDVEYVFTFNGNELKKAFFDMLSAEDIKSLSFKAAEIYEQRFINSNDFNEALIEYLMDSDNLVKAARFCVIFSDYYFEKSNSHKALDLLEKALEIYEKLGDGVEIGKTTKRLVKHYIKVGRLERAIDAIDTIEQNEFIKEQNDFIDIGIERAVIAYYKNEVQKAIDISNSMLEKSVEVNYSNGEFEAARIKARCLRNSGDLIAHSALTAVYLEKSYAFKNVKYQAVFENEKGINYLYSNAFEEAIACLNRSLTLYQAIADDENVITLLNNFGVIYLDGFGDYYLARDYFRKAYNRASNRNYFVSVPTYLNNIGETYRIEGRYTTAIKYFEESYQMAENVGDRNIIVLALLNMCQAYLLNESYAKTHTIINRLEHEINIIKRRDYDKFDYFMLHFEYYLAMNAVVKVDKWRYEFNGDDVLDDFRKYRLSIIDLRLLHRKNHVIFNQKLIPLDDIIALKAKIQNPSEVKLLRDFINDLMFDLIDDTDYVLLDKLCQLDDELKETYNTKSIRMRREIIDACLSDNTIERLQTLIPFFKEHSQEMLWRIYKILGDEYYYEDDLYHALQHYLMSLDVLSDLSKEIVHEYRETYILYDDVKMALKTRINKIVEIFVQQQDSIDVTLLYEERIESVEDYFDLSLYNMLYDNEIFTHLIAEHYVSSGVKLFNSPTNLIQSLGKDELQNLKMILQFFEQITFSEKAEMYLFDEFDNISETITTHQYDDVFDIKKLLNTIGSDTEGIYVNKIDASTNVQLLIGDQKGIICFPIHESDVSLPHLDKRREDLLLVKKRVVGYVFIETKNVINHINQSTFAMCKSFISLIYLMMNNYHLKRVSTIDKLTGVFLRKHIEQEFTKELTLARLQNAPLSVIMLDIDKFKNVNDNYGHRKGDEILSNIGDIIKQSIRKADYVGRYGGEEFIIVLPETDAEDGYNVAEKIRKLVEAKHLLGDEMPLTVSLGVSTFPIDGSNEEELVEKADQSLYYSKNTGRNKATSWDERLNKEGHRYDKLTGILTGNISSDTRNVKALLDIVKQLEDESNRVLNTFMTLMDIMEAEEISFVKLDESGEIVQNLFKKKGQSDCVDKLGISPRLVERFKNTSTSTYFVDWEEIISYDEATHIPNWKSYIFLSFNEANARGMLAISVNIQEKEFDFSNLNFVESLRPVLKHTLF